MNKLNLREWLEIYKIIDKLHYSLKSEPHPETDEGYIEYNKTKALEIIAEEILLIITRKEY